ncbi:MAG: hypothetical protein ACI358_05245 [Candidatus Limimorpha sp.]
MHRLEMLQSLIMGVRFDIVVMGFVIAITTAVLSVFSFFWKKKQDLREVLPRRTTVLFSFIFIICAADIPYFNRFFDRFNITAFEWIRIGDSSFVFIADHGASLDSYYSLLYSNKLFPYPAAVLQAKRYQSV